MNNKSWQSLDCGVQDGLKKVLADEGFESNVDIKASEGSESGDGYTTKTYAITITDSKKKLELFVKYFPIHEVQKKDMIIKIFHNEEIFYSDIYPTLIKFQTKKNVKEPFNNVPGYFCSGTSRGLKPIILENLKVIGYDCRERYNQIDDEHLNLALKTFGKLHATTFALKDQEYETYKKISDGIEGDVMETMMESGLDKVLAACINKFTDDLHPVNDCDLLKATDGLAKKLVDFAINIRKNRQDKYSIILQGDCWSNNMMFLYKNSKVPLDIKLIDWQILRVHYPVIDLSYFFYSVATPEMLTNWEHHLWVYYKYFSEHCSNLGSKPDRLYPFEMLKDHWKKYSRYGLCMAFLLVKVMLFEKDEAPDFRKYLETDTMDADLFNPKTKHQDVYDRRMKDILRHFVENKFI